MRTGDERSDYAPLECSEQTTGFVYFIGSEDGHRIKVGWSSKSRLDRLQNHAEGDAFGRGGNYTTLAVVRGTKACEAQIHKFFRRHLIAKKEVFTAAPLLPYVSWLRDQYYVSTTEAEFHTPQGQTVMESQVWLPGEGRVSTRESEPSLLHKMEPWAILPSRIQTGDDWYTPPEYLTCIRRALGGVIDLDPASHVMANQKVGALRFYTRDQNGLSQPWAGRVYLNPPFSEWAAFVPKVLDEADRLDAIVMLGATRTLSAQYFQPLLRRVDAFAIIGGRRAFWGIATDTDSPTDGHFLLYIGPEVNRFVAAIEELGPAWVTPSRVA